MPARERILEVTARTANEAAAVAVFWHYAVAVALLALAFGWRPAVRVAGAGLILPIISVAFLSWVHASPFNGAVFSALGIVLGGVVLRLPHAQRLNVATSLQTIAGLVLIAFGWVYPHFLVTESFGEYLYAAPMGVVPCPTLAMLIGFTLLGDGLGSRAWSTIVSVAGLFYGVFGWLVLGVRLDVVLAAGAALLLSRSFVSPRIVVPVS